MDGHCENMTMSMLCSRLSFFYKRQRVTSAASHPGRSTSGYAASAMCAEDEQRDDMGELPQGESPWASHSSNRTCLPVETPLGGFNFSFGACEDCKLSIAASEGRLEPSEAEDLPGPPPPGVAA